MALEHRAAFSIGDTSGGEYIGPGQGSLLSPSSSVSQDLATAEVPPAAAAAADAAAALLTAALASLAAAELYCNRCRFDSTSSRSAAQVGSLRKGSNMAVRTPSEAYIETNVLQHPSCYGTGRRRAVHVSPGRAASKRTYLEKSPKRAAEAPQRSRLDGVFSCCWFVKTYRIRAGQQM